MEAEQGELAAPRSDARLKIRDRLSFVIPIRAAERNLLKAGHVGAVSFCLLVRPELRGYLCYEFTKHARLSFSHVNGAPSPTMVIEFLCALSTAALTWSVTVKKTLSEDSSESNRLSPAPRK